MRDSLPSKPFGGRFRQDSARPSARRAAWEEFCKDEQLRKTHKIKPEEIELLREMALLGNVRSKADFIFILNVVRCSRRG